MAELTIKAHAKTPRVPNFIQLGTGAWLPLCAFTDEALVTLSNEWLEQLRIRAKEQKKDENKFYKDAEKGQADG